MNFKRFLPYLIGAVIILEGVMFYNHYTYGYHTKQVRKNLVELHELLENPDKESKMIASVVSDVVSDSEAQLNQLTKKILSFSEYAMENADDIRKVAKLKEAIGEISELQDETIAAISQVLETVEDEEIKSDVQATYDKAVQLKEELLTATQLINHAEENEEKEVAIDIVTDKEMSHGARHQEVAHHEPPAPAPAHENPNIARIEEQKRKDAEQREANRQRIMLIQQGQQSKKSQEIKNRIEKAQQLRSEKQTDESES